MLSSRLETLLCCYLMITVWFKFNIAAMEGIYTKRQVIIPVTKKLYPWFSGEGSKF